MSAKQVNIVQGTPEWHEWRRPRAGASDTPALFDKSPYKTKRDLWFEKAGLGRPDDEDRSYIYQRGHDVEAEIRDQIQEATGIEINPTCFENGPIFGASLDGHDKSLGVLEAKLVGKDVHARAIEGEIPEHHRIQIQHQLYTAEADKAFWAGRAPKVKRTAVVEIGRDEEMIARIKFEVESFWESLAAGEVPPLTARDTLFITDPKVQALFQRLAQLKVQKDEIEARYSEIEAEVKGLASHPKIQCGLVTVSESERKGSIDYTKIPEINALGEEYLEKFRKKSAVVKTIRFKKEA